MTNILNEVYKHITNWLMTNPHKVEQQQIDGLRNVDNTSDLAKPVSRAMSEALDNKVNIADVYDALTTDDSRDDFATIPLSAAQGKTLADTIGGLSDVDSLVASYDARIATLEDMLTNNE